MDIGKLRHRVAIQAPTAAQDASGQDIESWADVLVVWASIKPASGSVSMQGQAGLTTSIGTHEIVMRYTPVLKSTSRLRYGPAAFTALTSAQFAVMNSVPAFDALGTAGTAGRFFTVNGMPRNVEETRVMTFLTVTEVQT